MVSADLLMAVSEKQAQTAGNDAAQIEETQSWYNLGLVLFMLLSVPASNVSGRILLMIKLAIVQHSRLA